MRLFSTTTTAISLRKSPILSQSPRRSVYALSQVFFTPTTRFGGILSFSDRPTTEMAHLFPGCDYKHWLIVMDHKPGGEGATKQQMIDCYVQTLAKLLGSEEEAKKKIYSVSCERYFGFGCEIDEETSNKFEGMNGVLFVLPDSYVDSENKDYGGEVFAPC
ncbi:multiple organellar RNA editing factor 5, chloroplastic/mitochondrial-like [Lotus japonicus]|uniref:multiple organellar RNA editing factor 5, chloroplastic/mitochondrial-like n=1 Tax=Lotus japonicus TaxID=34305 RepID=UPI0025841022|nr:multiple organellar RNA editing factor 5, chloroplastic/mitochondrial-like [Lotus japonicus]